MELRPGLTVDEAALSAFATEHGVARLLLYGSVLRADFRADSDVDVLIEFLPERTPGLLGLAQMELALEALVGRSVDLRTRNDLSRHIRDRVIGEARLLYVADAVPEVRAERRNIVEWLSVEDDIDLPEVRMDLRPTSG